MEADGCRGRGPPGDVAEVDVVEVAVDEALVRLEAVDADEEADMAQRRRDRGDDWW